MKQRTFTDLKKSMTEETLNKFCKRIAESYANSETRFARSYYGKNENITESCFYKVLERAVEMNLVSEKTVDKMERKAEANRNLHVKGAGVGSLVKYEVLRKKRNDYIISNYTKEQITTLATEFANNPEMSKKEFADKYGVCTMVIDKILVKAIVENIVDDETFAKIEKRTIEKNAGNAKTTKFFEALRQKRQHNKENSF